MATQSWPEGLPNPATAYSIEPENEVVETEYETGEQLQRLQVNTHFALVSATWLFTDAEFLIFKTWFFENLNQGTEKFNVDLTLGDGLNSYEAQWISGATPFQASYQQVLYWNVTATLRIQDTKELSEMALEIMVEEYPDETAQNFLDASDALDNYIEITLPGAVGSI